MRTLPVILLALALVALPPTASADRLPELSEIDLTWLTACPGPWGHEERTRVGPVTVVTYVCDEGDV